jgi:methylenetetrahydrofolate dehydrogenase (NADP+)/methenyltetrahydrofolate cyclohydrolase
MLINRRATVTDCHSKTSDLAKHTRNADILITAVGKEKLITAGMVKKGAVVVDVGTNRNKQGKMVGDVDYASVSKKASYITPVPGGVGPMTVACLMENVYKATLKQISKGML